MDRFSVTEKTIGNPFNFAGIGIHSGKMVSVKVAPAPAGNGIVFRRADLGNIEIKAVATNIRSMFLGSCLSVNENDRIITLEHLMAAISALGISNLVIETDGEEIPILDGSASGYVALLSEAGLVEQEDKIHAVVLEQELWVGDNENHVIYIPADNLKISYFVDYRDEMIGKQSYLYEHSKENFCANLMKARTFGFEKDVQMMRDRGLALGGSFENALVVYDDHFSTPLRYENEPVRHKILDLVGDIALLGRQLHGHVIAIKSNHSLNGRFVKQIAKIYSEQKGDPE